MVKLGPDGVDLDDGEQFAHLVQQSDGAWEKTLEDMQMMAADREDAGYDVVTLPAADTTPKTLEASEDDEWGLSYIVPSNFTESFTDIYERATFEETGVYQATVGSFTFIVTECLDHENELAVFVAGAYRLQFASPLVRKALEEGKMYTHIKQLDGTTLGTIEHDDPDAFFPNPEEIYSYELSL